MKYEKIILSWCKCPKVYDDEGNQLFHQFASGIKDKDEDYNIELGICDLCNGEYKKKKLIKRRLTDSHVIIPDDVIEVF